MNNECLVWQIRRGQASPEEADVLLCDVWDACRQSKDKMLEIQTISIYCEREIRDTCDKTAGLSPNPQKREEATLTNYSHI